MDTDTRKRLDARRQRHKDEGLCASCTREAEPDKTLCDYHLYYHRALKREKRSRAKRTGTCYRCLTRSVRKGRTTCDPCIDRLSELYYQKRYDAMKRGVCVHCRFEPQEEGSTHCADCKQYIRERNYRSTKKRAQHEQPQEAVD